MPPRTPSSSPHQSALPFIAQTMLGVLSLNGLCSLCIQHSQLGSGKRLSTSFESQPSKAMNQHLHNQAETSTATYQLCDKISTRLRCKPYHNWSRTQFIQLWENQWSNQGHHRCLTGISFIKHSPPHGHLRWSCLTQRVPHTLWQLSHMLWQLPSSHLFRTSWHSISRKYKVVSSLI